MLDFHHVDPSQKEFTIIDGYRNSDDKLIAEIEKCVCLCANCHREFHHFYGLQPDNPIEALDEYLSSNNNLTIQN